MKRRPLRELRALEYDQSGLIVLEAALIGLVVVIAIVGGMTLMSRHFSAPPIEHRYMAPAVGSPRSQPVAVLPAVDTLTVLERPLGDQFHPGMTLSARYSIAPPPACHDPAKALDSPSCEAYVHQSARLSLWVRFHGLLVMTRSRTVLGQWDTVHPSAAFGRWTTTVFDLDLDPRQCVPHRTFRWQVTLLDPYGRGDVVRSGNYAVTICPGE